MRPPTHKRWSGGELELAVEDQRRRGASPANGGFKRARPPGHRRGLRGRLNDGGNVPLPNLRLSQTAFVSKTFDPVVSGRCSRILRAWEHTSRNTRPHRTAHIRRE